MTKKKKRSRLTRLLTLLTIIIGIIVFLIGCTPEIAAVVGYDVTPPDIEGTYPQGSVDTPSPLTLGETLTLKLWSRSPDIDFTKTTALIGRPSDPSYMETVPLTPDPANQSEFTGTFIIALEGIYTFNFHLWDHAGNKSTRLVYGEVGDAQGDFYLKDGNDLDYTLVTKDASITFNHYTTYFKFIATEHGQYITNVRIDIVGYDTFDLIETTVDAVWDGSTWIAPSDGTYEINGYFTAFGRTFRTLSILGGINEEPTLPRPWSTYAWTKVLGIGLMAVGFMAEGWQRRRK